MVLITAHENSACCFFFNSVPFGTTKPAPSACPQRSLSRGQHCGHSYEQNGKATGEEFRDAAGRKAEELEGCVEEVDRWHFFRPPQYNLTNVFPILTILPVVLYGCESWSLTLREECRLRVFENRVLRRILGPKRNEVTGKWRRLHNKELYALYSSPNIIRVIKSRRLRWAGHVARMGESRGAYRLLVGQPEGMRSLGKPRRRWEDNIKMDL
jgi:hypothetical protein